jgi:hypothetical protein
MFAAAHIVYDNRQHDPTLHDLQRQLDSFPNLRARPWQWEGFGIVVPQILIEAEVSFTLQIDDDPKYVLPWIEEVANYGVRKLNPAALDQLQRCNARIDVMAALAAPASVIEGVGVVFAFTDVDPAEPSVSRVIREVTRLLNGLAYDCVNGAWMHWEQADSDPVPPRLR